MSNPFCHLGKWSSFTDIGVWGWIGFILNLVFWVTLLAGLALFVVWAARHARVPTATVPYASGQPTPKEILQTRYARGKITREQYQQMLVDVR